MSRGSRIAGTASTPSSTGVIAGAVLRACREAIGGTQERFAELVGVDLNTIKGWETGRRPLMNASGRTLLMLRRRLLQLGTPADLVQHLDTAMDADLFISNTLENGTEHSLLGDWVATRAWSDLLAWGLAGRTPDVISKHLGTGPRASLTPDIRRLFFAALRRIADVTQGESPDAMLLRRQVYYMAAWDPESEQWLASTERYEIRQHGRRAHGWTPAWPLLRSIAVARACQGDPTLLHDFIENHLADDLCEAANLNYWSYWVEETTGIAGSDDFMAVDLGARQGGTLLRHLADGLAPDVPYLPLSIHASCALIQRRPALIMEDHELARRLEDQAAKLLDLRVGLPARTRRELENIRFAAKMVAGPA